MKTPEQKLQLCERCKNETPDYTTHLVYDDIDVKVWIVKCRTCGNTKAFTTTFERQEEVNYKAYKVWNTRTPDPLAKEELRLLADKYPHTREDLIRYHDLMAIQTCNAETIAKDRILGISLSTAKMLESDPLAEKVISPSMSFAVCAAFHHEEITRSKARELHGFKSIQEFNAVYSSWLRENKNNEITK